MFFKKNEQTINSDDRSFWIGLLGGVLGSVFTMSIAVALFHSGILSTGFKMGEKINPSPLSILPIFSGNKNIAQASAPDHSSVITAKALDVSDIVAKVNPAVVSIVISKDVPVMQEYDVNPFGANSPFQMNIPQYRQNGTQTKEVGGGSGFIISSDGYIVSNAHVVNDPGATYAVFLNGGKKYSAKVIALDETLDIALLKIEAKDLSPITFGNSDTIKLGQTVIAIGNALGEFRNTVSTGVVSGLARSIQAGDGGSVENLDNLIQTDAAINPGNSGGPLLDNQGEVVGVNVAVAQGSQNIGFSIPVNAIKQAVESMKTNGRVIRPYLGVRYLPITSDLQKQNHLSVDHGVLVVRGQNQTDLAVIPGSPANKAGIVEYDIILEADGVKIDDTHLLSSIIRQKKVGDILKLKVSHNGVEKMLEIKMEEAPAA